jgi:hypothetical protein
VHHAIARRRDRLTGIQVHGRGPTGLACHARGDARHKTQGGEESRQARAGVWFHNSFNIASYSPLTINFRDAARIGDLSLTNRGGTDACLVKSDGEGGVQWVRAVVGPIAASPTTAWTNAVISG